MKACPNCAKESAAGAVECAFCGLVFAKWRDPASKPVSRQVVSVSLKASLDPLLWGGAAVLAGALFLIREPLRRSFFLLDGADLIIHEAGHPIFGLLGNHWLMMAGGTLLQLIMPLAFWWDFRRRDHPRSALVCLAWVGQNFFHIGRYAADARAQDLPLVGGGVHDWTYLLETVGLLTHDIGVGRAFDFIGCALIAYAVVSLIRAPARVSASADRSESRPGP